METAKIRAKKSDAVVVEAKIRRFSILQGYIPVRINRDANVTFPPSNRNIGVFN